MVSDFIIVIAFASWKWNTKGSYFAFSYVLQMNKYQSLCYEKYVILWSSILKAYGNFYISVTQKKILWSPPTAHNGRVLCHVNPDPTAAVPVRMGLKREKKKKREVSVQLTTYITYTKLHEQILTYVIFLKKKKQKKHQLKYIKNETEKTDYFFTCSSSGLLYLSKMQQHLSWWNLLNEITSFYLSVITTNYLCLEISFTLQMYTNLSKTKSTPCTWHALSWYILVNNIVNSKLKIHNNLIFVSLEIKILKKSLNNGLNVWVFFS